MEAFDLFFENHPTPMWIYDLETLAFLTVNNAALLKYGYTKEEFLQLTLRDIRPSAEIPRLLADIEQVRPEWQQSGLWPHQLRDGTLVQVEITSHTIEFNGRSAALVMAQDRTEQVALQNELIRREAQLRTTLYSIGDAVIATDINGRVTLMNPVATQLTGWPESEAQGRPLVDIFPIINEYSRQPVDNPVTQVLQEGVTVGLANYTLLIHRDGSERPIADAAAPIWDIDNQLTGVVLIFRDQTVERQAQTAIRQAKKRLERAEEQAGLGSWEFDISTQKGYWSPQMFRLFDLEPAAVAPGFDTYLALIHPEDRSIVQQALTAISSGSAPFTQTYRTNPDKVTPRYLRPSWRIHRDETGQPVRFEGTLLDVTQQFEAEEKIGYQAEQMVQIMEKELALQQQLQQQERLAAVGQLAAGMAHDFNNIMGVIILYAQFLARSTAFSEKEREQLATIETQANRASALIEQILDFSRQAMLARQPLDLRQLLREEIELLHRTLPEHIEIELVSEEGEYMVQADPTRLQQSFMNLALNARDAMPQGGQLRFALWQQQIDKGQRPTPDMEPGRWLCLQVSDTGQGIETTVLDHIFEPFFTTKETGTGTGLGLAQVYGIIRQHGGHVLVESHPGQGSIFTIYLPALAATAVRQETRRPAAAPAGSGQLLLIVEDQAALRAALVDSLQAWGYQTAEAAHGEEALAILHKQNREIALVLSDVIMPRMGGVALAQAIREQGWSIPIILLTGHPQEEKETLEVADIRALLAKPVDSTRLAQAIATALA